MKVVVCAIWCNNRTLTSSQHQSYHSPTPKLPATKYTKPNRARSDHLSIPTKTSTTKSPQPSLSGQDSASSDNEHYSLDITLSTHHSTSTFYARTPSCDINYRAIHPSMKHFLHQSAHRRRTFSCFVFKLPRSRSCFPSDESVNDIRPWEGNQDIHIKRFLLLLCFHDHNSRIFSLATRNITGSLSESFEHHV